jgi:hypothetical protein
MPRTALVLAAMIALAPAGVTAQPPDPVHGEWSLLALTHYPGDPLPPAPRAGHAAVRDPVRDRMIVFGGFNATSTNQVWTLSLDGSHRWELMATAGTPPQPRRYHAMVHDPVRDRLIVIGGLIADGTVANDVWALSLSGAPTWTRLLPGGPALTPRRNVVAVYDPPRDRVIIHGGYNGLFFLDETWSLLLGVGDAPRWTQIAPPGPKPVARNGAAAVYDPVRERMVVYGGWSGTSYLGDVWALALSGLPSWTALAPSGTAPSPRRETAAVYDPAGDRMVVFGGFANNVYLRQCWALALGDAPAWTALAPAGEAPTARIGHSAILDPARGSMVMFGGYDRLYLSDAWSLDLDGATTWTPLETEPLPVMAARRSHTAIYEPLEPSLLIHGGVGAFVWDDAWALSLGFEHQWRPVASSTQPPPSRIAHSAVYDAPRHRMVSFGGISAAGFSDETWSLDLDGTRTWALIPNPVLRPNPRAWHACTLDPLRERMIVHGGQPPLLGDLWALSLAGPQLWTQLFPAGTGPTPRQSHVAVFDPRRDRVLFFGGLLQSSLETNEVWELALSPALTWSRLEPLGTPPSPRRNLGGIYDPLRDRMVFFGGVQGTRWLNETWALNLDGLPTWQQLSPARLPPEARNDLTATYDPRFDRMVVFGGWNGVTFLSDAWALTWGQADPTPVQLALVESQAEPGRVRLVWSTGGPTGEEAVVQRRTVGGGWAERARVASDGAGRITYEDAGVVAGTRYAYRLILARSTGEVTSAETWISVPAAWKLAMAPPAPNPSDGRFTVAFTLAQPGAARLELLDLRGRQMAARELGGLPAGPHRAALDAGRDLSPGIYWLRLVSAEGRRGTRVCVVR